jgi:acylphosphatase
MPRVHLCVRGRVQGVGFRYFVLRLAQGLALTGWVRNRRDGSVEIEAEGEAQAIEKLVEAVSQGPPGARVAAVERAVRPGVRDQRGFRVADEGEGM